MESDDNLILRGTKTRKCGSGSHRPYYIFLKYIYTVKFVKDFILKDTCKQIQLLHRSAASGSIVELQKYIHVNFYIEAYTITKVSTSLILYSSFQDLEVK